jgi:hypothetical protein
MRNYKSLFAAAAIMTFASGPVFAAAAGVTAGTTTAVTGNMNATTGGNSGNASGSATANGNASADFSQLMTSVQGASAGTTQIQGLKSVKSVNVLKITDIATGNDQTALDGAMTTHKQGMASLRSAVCSNTAINAALSKKSVDCKTVVAANVSADGALTVYVD